jgi:hypothetical protein
VGHSNHDFEKGKANGLATLDAGVQVPLAQLQGVAGTKDMLTAVVDPVQTDDDTQGYAIGSVWLNQSNRRFWTCFDATTNTAVWRRGDNTNQSENLGREAPDEHFIGALLNYSATGSGGNGEIQYTRIWLISGTVLTDMRCYIAGGGTGSREVRMGIYDQTDPLAVDGLPVNRVAQTNAVATAGANGSFFTQALTSSYTVAATGYYWVALIQSSAALSFVTTQSFEAGFLPVRREAGTGSTLPATAGTLTNPTSAVIYASGVE